MTTPPPTSPAGKAVEASGFIFSPVKCFRRGEALQCTISFQNVGNEAAKLRIEESSSHLIDNRGNQYRVRVAIGRTSDTHGTRPYAETFLPQVSVNVHFLSKNVATDVTHMTAVISIKRYEGGSYYSSDPKLVAVRNIPIAR